MIIVLFEVTIKKDCMDQYLSLAGKLKESLVQAEGFIRAERFSSFVNERKLLSLSVWESEDAVEKWRNQEEHRLNQRQGRDALFESYVITIASSVRIYTDKERQEAPRDSNKVFDSSNYAKKQL